MSGSKRMFIMLLLAVVFSICLIPPLTVWASDTTPPTVTSTYPANGATGVSVTTGINARFSEDTFEGSAFTQINLKDSAGNPVPISVAYPTSVYYDTCTGEEIISVDRTRIDITSQVQLAMGTTYTVTLPASAVVDGAGNPLAAMQFSFTTATDAPFVTGTDPGNQATSVPVDKTISVYFSENIVQGDTVNLVTVSDGTSQMQVALSVINNVLMIDPQSSLGSETTYYVTIPAGAVKDIGGKPLAADYSFSFTAADVIAPTIASSDPTDGATGVAVDKTIFVYLSEGTDYGPAFGGIALRDSRGNTISARISYDWIFVSSDYDGWDERVDNTIVIDPDVNLTKDETYTVSFPPGAVQDYAGNQSPARSFSFTVVRDTAAPAVKWPSPYKGQINVPLDKTITLTFDKLITQGENFGDISVVAGGSPVPFTASVNRDTLIIDPTSNLGYSTDCTVTVPAGAVQNFSGIPLAAPYSFNFSTCGVVKMTDPAGWARNVPVDKTITLTYWENISPGSTFDDVTLKDENGNEVTATVTINGNILSIDPVVSLDYDTMYSATLPANAVVTASGRPSSFLPLNFSTPDNVAPKVSSTDPAHNEVNVLLDKTITIWLSEGTDYGPAFSGIALRNSAGIPVDASIGYEQLYFDDGWDFWYERVDNKIIIDPYMALSEGETYTISVPEGAVIDYSGNASVAFTASFTTVGAPDTGKPTVDITSPVGGTTYLLNQIVLADWTATDPSGIASVTATTPNGQPIDTVSVGVKSFNVTAVDTAGNEASRTVSYNVTYDYSGVLPPINNDGTSVFNMGNGRTIPVKFRLKDAGGSYIGTSDARIYLTKLSDLPSSGTSGETVPNDGTEGNKFTYDTQDNLYIYHLRTDTLTEGVWQVKIVLDGTITHTVEFSLQKPQG